VFGGGCAGEHAALVHQQRSRAASTHVNAKHKNRSRPQAALGWLFMSRPTSIETFLTLRTKPD